MCNICRKAKCDQDKEKKTNNGRAGQIKKVSGIRTLRE